MKITYRILTKDGEETDGLLSQCGTLAIFWDRDYGGYQSTVEEPIENYNLEICISS